jgi:DNA repair photolyase
MKTWDKTKIYNDHGELVEAIQPVIISASRSTDIPAFYHKWLINRMEKGYIGWINPFNRKMQYVSFGKTRLIVFWTKNALPLIPHLEYFDRKNINYYFQYTINDYEHPFLSPPFPPLHKRIDTFKKLSDLIGKEKVIWRFDPFILTDKIDVQSLLNKIARIGDEFMGYTEKLVFSFADINVYKKVQNNLRNSGVYAHEFRENEIHELMKGLTELNNKWNYTLATCAEKTDLSMYEVEHNRCIDDELMVRLFKDDKELMNFLGYTPPAQHFLFDEKEYKPNPKLKDKGQRAACGCIMSKDIGMYNTCNHLCTYCYANHSEKIVRKNLSLHNPEGECIIVN